MRNIQSGFTLIELVMVIVILGILAAFALPKFADLSGDAERASTEAGLAAVKSAAGIYRAAFLAGGSTDPTIEGNTYGNVNGYPRCDDIGTLAGLDISYTVDDTTSCAAATGVGDAVVTLGGCTFTYTTAASADAGPTYTPAAGGVTCP